MGSMTIADCLVHPCLAKLYRRGLVGGRHLKLSINSRHLCNPSPEEGLASGWVFGMGHWLVGMIPGNSAVLQPCSPLCNSILGRTTLPGAWSSSCQTGWWWPRCPWRTSAKRSSLTPHPTPSSSPVSESGQTRASPNGATAGMPGFGTYPSQGMYLPWGTSSLALVSAKRKALKMW